VRVHLVVVLAARPVTTTPDPSQAIHDAFHSLVPSLLPLWPLAAIVAVIGLGKVLVQLWKLRRLNRAGIFEIDRMMLRASAVLQARVRSRFSTPAGASAPGHGSASGRLTRLRLLRQRTRTRVGPYRRRVRSFC